MCFCCPAFAQPLVDAGDVPLGLLVELPVAVKNGDRRMKVCHVSRGLQHCTLVRQEPGELVGTWLEPNEELKLKAVFAAGLPSRATWKVTPSLYLYDPVTCTSANLDVKVHFKTRRELGVTPGLLELAPGTEKDRAVARVVIEYGGYEDIVIRSIRSSDETITVSSNELSRGTEPTGIIRTKFEIVASKAIDDRDQEIDERVEVTVSGKKEDVLTFPILIRAKRPADKPDPSTRPYRNPATGR